MIGKLLCACSSAADLYDHAPSCSLVVRTSQWLFLPRTDFDQDAYMAAAHGHKAAAEFFWSRMVMTEGSHVRCRRTWVRGFPL